MRLELLVPAPQALEFFHLTAALSMTLKLSHGEDSVETSVSVSETNSSRVNFFSGKLTPEQGESCRD